MGQKTHPIGYRLGYIYDWESKWYAERSDYIRQFLEDTKIRNYIKERMPQAGISKIIIERFGKKIKINLHTGRPGIVIGRGGAEIEKLRKELQQMLGTNQLQIDVYEVKVPELDAQLVAENVAFQIEKKVAYRRAMKQAVRMALDRGAKGIKIACAGRLGGAEIGRKEWYKEGRIPLHTLRAEIDYGRSEAITQYGVIGVKVWICKGEKIPGKKEESIENKESR